MQQTLQFLLNLSRNNNREWFEQHKAEYTSSRERFTAFSEEYIRRLSELDPSLAELTPKDCIWRIYRDVRFSNDKRPYKEWFGVFPAAPAPGTSAAKTGGKKSMRGGYYVHLQPGHCMFAGGIWCPSPELLKALRKEVIANYDEVEAIMDTPTFRRYFTDFDTEWMLKKVPAGYDLSSLPEPHATRVAEWIKRKAFTVSTPLTDEEVCSPHFMEHLMKIAAAVKPLNDFLNYTFEEYGEFPDRC